MACFYNVKHQNSSYLLGLWTFRDIKTCFVKYLMRGQTVESTPNFCMFRTKQLQQGSGISKLYFQLLKYTRSRSSQDICRFKHVQSSKSSQKLKVSEM